ncbi:MAG: RluA family pseudouridine synthase [Patescibacteria group bacterium]|nr:RluA family pseudouridine synthase [Patescibacteria group bacterium]MCL5093817.1 RluA family pseudouridine synthase [Patescibacteria group bacterium]
MRIETEGEENKRLDKFLNSKLVKYPSDFIKKLIKEGKVLIDSKVASPGYIIKKHQHIDIEIPKEENSPKNSFELPIVHEDNDILVLEKPSGISVHPGEGPKEKTVADIIRPKIKIKGETGREGIVHRLDKDTSGLLVVAKNKKSLLNLTSQFKERRVEKGYIALIYGHLQPKKGEIIIPLERSYRDRKKRGVSALGKNAVTRYEVSEYISHEGDEFTLLDLNILTGRTHQIRVHLEAIGHPVVGDKIYTTKKFKETNEKYGIERQFLHAYKLGFHHPRTEKWLGFKINLPQDLNDFLAELKS